MNGLPSQFHLITSAIDFARENHKVISQNIANVNTPEYKARTISFDEYLVNSKSGPAEMKLEYVEGQIFKGVRKRTQLQVKQNKIPSLI